MACAVACCGPDCCWISSKATMRPLLFEHVPSNDDNGDNDGDAEANDAELVFSDV